MAAKTTVNPAKTRKSHGENGCPTAVLQVRKLSLLGLVILLMAGCVVGPDFSPPASPGIQPNYTYFPEDPNALPLQVWLDSFADQNLVQLLTTANTQNLNVRQAYFRIVEARASAGVVRGGLAPTADIVSEYSFRQQSANATPFVGSNAEPFNFFLKGFESAWQIDLFGKIKRSIEAAEANVCFNEFDLEFIRRTLLSDVAATYVRIRLLQDQLVLLKHNLEVQEQTEKLVEEREGAGVSTQLDSLQTRSFIERTKTAETILQQQLNLEINALSVLLGQVPTVELREFLGEQVVLQTPAIPAPGFPANLLRDRPDVRREERAFAAALAQIGVAEADLYPQLTLVGNISVSAQTVSSLFTSESLAFDIGPSFRWNIVQFGRVKNSIEAARARCEQAQLNYQQTVLVAVREVEDSISQFNGFRRQTESLSRAIEADEKAVELSLERYKAGKANFQRVLDAQEQLLQDFQQRSATRHQAIEELVRMYNALGGNWSLLANRCVENPGATTTTNLSDPWNVPSCLPQEVVIEPAMILPNTTADHDGQPIVESWDESSAVPQQLTIDPEMILPAPLSSEPIPEELSLSESWDELQIDIQ